MKIGKGLCISLQIDPTPLHLKTHHFQVFIRTRQWVMATYQKIVFYDWLPELVGESQPEYEGLLLAARGWAAPTGWSNQNNLKYGTDVHVHARLKV